ncbi:MAG: signal peptidase I [Paucibacter sp.]|nr:signal peptidase I [Roseateles sp.]
MKRFFRDNRGFIAFLVCFGLMRTALADWNPIPSGSMRPTLLEGDVVLVNRVAYDLKLPLTEVVLAHLGDPRRGDVVTFSSPRNGDRLIKRVVGLPGDVVEMRDEKLLINGAAVSYSEAQDIREQLVSGASIPAVRATEHLQGHDHQVQVMPTVAARRDFGPVTVPAGQYFMLGDNRDNSADSRYIGFVPREKLIGRAHRVLVSADILDSWQPRFGRFVSTIL